MHEKENYLLKIKKGNLKLNEEELVKYNTFKFNLVFKYYDFVKKSEEFKGYYVSEASPASHQNNKDDSAIFINHI